VLAAAVIEGVVAGRSRKARTTASTSRIQAFAFLKERGLPAAVASAMVSRSNGKTVAVRFLHRDL
jgi:hypothetical protein